MSCGGCLSLARYKGVLGESVAKHYMNPLLGVSPQEFGGAGFRSAPTGGHSAIHPAMRRVSAARGGSTPN